MNERVRELMVQAGYAAPELAGRAQKLAQLIVNECVTVLQEPTNDSEWDGYNAATASAIIEHFGDIT